jgi:uncharacterized membrane protein
MKTILRRNDNTSIYCPNKGKQGKISSMKNKVIEASIGCILLGVGLFLIVYY